MDISKYVRFIEKNRGKVIFFWVLLMTVSLAFYASGFFDKTATEFKPPDNSQTAEAMALQEKYFPETVNTGDHIITIHDTTNVINSDLAKFTQEIWNWTYANYANITKGVQGYFIVANTALDYLKGEYVSSDNTTTFIAISVETNKDAQNEYLLDLRSEIQGLDLGHLDVYVTGAQALSYDTDHSIERDLSRIDAITIPLVFLLLIVLLRNWRYFPITMSTIALALSITFAILDRIITYFDVTILSFVPSVLISLTLGIGVDYNLFLLSRFREERKKGQSNIEAVTKMMKSAGHTVFTSGMTLVISMAGLIFFPISMINSLGIAVAIGITLLLIINLSFTPAILVLFGNWFERPQNQQGNKAPVPEITDHTGLWYKIAKLVTKRSLLVLLVILMLTLPLASQLIDTNPQTQTQFFAPRNSDSSKGFQLLEEKFDPGLISPLQLIYVPNEGNVWSPESFNNLHNFIGTAINTTAIQSVDIQSHTWLGGQRINYTTASLLTTPSSPVYNSVDGAIYRQFAYQFVSQSQGKENLAAVVRIIMPVDPNSEKARDLLHELENIAQTTLGASSTFGFFGQTAVNDAAIQSSYDLFPIMILFVVLAIYALVGLMFKSVFLPARLILTIGLTLSFIYGAATVIFQDNTFINTLFPIVNDVSVLFWMLPIMSFSIILGLGMDYDIFTIERIKENVWSGLDTDEAIAQGLNKTGRIITGAGLIMMVAFGGMMFSSNYILIQFGFVLTFAVFMDTFIVRSLLVPSIMSISEKYNWWPNHPPKQ